MSSSEFAPQDKVRELYIQVSQWLEENGDDISNPDDFEPERHLGKLVVNGLEPGIEFHVDPAPLRQFAPLVYEHLELAHDATSLSFWYTPEHYVTRPHGKSGDPDHVLPSVEFLIHKKQPQSSLEEETLGLIYDPDSTLVYTQRRYNAKNGQRIKLVSDYISDKVLQGEAGSLTNADYSCLEQFNNMLRTVDLDTLRHEEPWQDAFLRDINENL